MTEQIGLGSELTKRTGGVVAAEGVGIAASLGSLLLVKKIAGPERMAAAKEQVAMDVMLPLLNRVDATLGKFHTMRERMGRGGQDGSKTAEKTDTTDSATELVDKASNASGATAGRALKKAKSAFEEEKLSPEEKARKYADLFLDMSIMMPVGIVTRILAQSKADTMFGAPDIDQKHYLYAKAPDFVANNVSLVGMNTVAKAPAQAVTRVMERLLKGVGVPEESAKSMATYLTYVQGSNIIGNMANVGYVTGVSRRNAQAAINPPDQSR